MLDNVAVETMDARQVFAQQLGAMSQTNKLRNAKGEPIYPYALIRFFERLMPTEPESVDLGINGKMYKIKRGEIVPIPYALVEVAEHAETPVWKTESDGVSDRKVLVGYRPRYPFEVIGGINEEEAAELKAIMSQNGRLGEGDVFEYRHRASSQTKKAKSREIEEKDAEIAMLRQELKKSKPAKGDLAI